MPQVYISSSSASRTKMANMINPQPPAAVDVEDKSEGREIDMDPPKRSKLSKKSQKFWKG